MRRVFIVFMALVGFASEASACECVAKSVPFAIQPTSRDVYAIGRVREIRPADPDGWYGNVVVIEITDGLRNATTGETDVFYTPAQDSACAYRFTSGVLYVIESTSSETASPALQASVPKGSRFVTRCGMTRQLDTPEGNKAVEEIRSAIERLPR
jgi:hypothetical protein